MHPRAAIGVADKVGMVVLHNEVVDAVPFRPALPFNALDNQRRTSTGDDAVADSETTGGNEALAFDIEGMLTSSRNRLLRVSGFGICGII